MNAKRLGRLLTTTLLLTGPLLCLGAEEIRARWTLESQEAMAGEKLILSLEVQGTDSITPPTFSIPGVDVLWQGGTPRNSTSIVSINGSTKTTVTKAFVGQWSLAAKEPGTYHLDPTDWTVGGTTIRLSALDWTVTPIREDARFFIKQTLSQAVAVPGIEIGYTMVWYLGESARAPSFSIPILDDPRLQPVEESLAPPKGASEDSIFKIDYKGHQLVGVQGVEMVKGKQYTTLTVSFKVKATAAGTFDLSSTQVTFQGAVDSRQTRDFFGNLVSEPRYRTLAAKGNELKLQVQDLPVRGKPGVFSGLIGNLSLAWKGSTGPYRVGEPIRLVLNLEGVLNKPDLDLDYMVTEALKGGDFVVSPDTVNPADSATEHAYIFRAKVAGKLSVPALSLNFFDPDKGSYGQARTPPIVLDIQGSTNQAKVTPAEGSAGSLPGNANKTSVPGAAGNPKAGAPINPPSLKRGRLFAPPWWTLALPCGVPGAVLLGLGLWRHSRSRKLRKARAVWLQKLEPLAAASSRLVLEEGRGRIHALRHIQGPWGELLKRKGYQARLDSEAENWDRAFFSSGKEDEPWKERWDAFQAEARRWK